MRNKKLRGLFVFAIIIIMPMIKIMGQNVEVYESDYSNQSSFRYRQNGLAIGSIIFRDKATSPLFYSGVIVPIEFAWGRITEERESKFILGLNIGSTGAKIPKSNFLQANTGSIISQLNMSYQMLWKIDSWSSLKNNVKIGGQIISTQNFRQNPSLQNNGLGLENLTNIMLSGKYTRDISRNIEKTFHFWFINQTLKPMKRDFNFKFDVGILNFNFRPGYAFSYVSQVNGLESNELSSIISGYRWSLNGWRLRAEFEFLRFLNKENARSIAYVWDAASAPGKFEPFQMASHQIKITRYLPIIK